MTKNLLLVAAAVVCIAACTGKKAGTGDEQVQVINLEDSVKERVVDLMKTAQESHFMGAYSLKIDEDVVVNDSVYVSPDYAELPQTIDDKMTLAGMMLVDYAAKWAFTSVQDSALFEMALKLIADCNVTYDVPDIDDNMTDEEKFSLWAETIMDGAKKDIDNGMIGEKVALLMGMQLEFGHIYLDFRKNHSVDLVKDNDKVFTLLQKAGRALADLYDIFVPYCEELKKYEPLVEAINVSYNQQGESDGYNPEVGTPIADCDAKLRGEFLSSLK